MKHYNNLTGVLNMPLVNKKTLLKYCNSKIDHIKAAQAKLDKDNPKKQALYNQYEGVLNACYETIIHFELNFTKE